MIHRKAAVFDPELRPKGERRGISHFSIVAETPTNENHHASGSRLTNKPCPKGVGLFLFAFPVRLWRISEKE